MTIRKCLICRKPFTPHRHVKHQQTCSDPACQRERRRRWQQAKRKADKTYASRQQKHTEAWLQAHPDYWHEYRNRHPEYAARNREQQKSRNETRRSKAIAKSDASFLETPLPAGIYELRQCDSFGIANGDAWLVKIALLSIASEG
jgi:hypothetical protein